MEITINDIQNNLKTLPEGLLGNVNDYIDFLKSKYRGEKEDWAENLTEFQKKSIERGISDISTGRTISHEEAKQKIREYLESKTM